MMIFSKLQLTVEPYLGSDWKYLLIHPNTTNATPPNPPKHQENYKKKVIYCWCNKLFLKTNRPEIDENRAEMAKMCPKPFF